MDHIRRIRTGVGTAQPGSDHATASSATVDRSTVPVPRKWDAILTPPIEGQTTVEDMSMTRNPFHHRRSRGPAPGKGHYLPGSHEAVSDRAASASRQGGPPPAPPRRSTTSPRLHPHRAVIGISPTPSPTVDRRTALTSD